MWKTFLLIVTILLLLECDPIQAWRRRRRRAPPCDRTPCSWAWSTCSNTCGGGMRSAIVTKRQGACGVCEPDLPEHCNDQLCPVHCEWSEWGAWGGCPVSCGGGTRVRTRNHSPPASDGGRDCKGFSQDVSTCNYKCCPINCKWREWGGFGPCSVSCGIGTETRSRSVQIAGSCGGTECLKISSSSSRQCIKSCCPVDCAWNNWTEFGQCSVTCGPGLKERTRTIKINSQCGGNSCPGESHERVACKSQDCPINCMWSEWTDWEQCSNSCGGGSQSASRTISTAPQHGGRDCGGASKQSRDCNTQCCKVDCEWDEWSTWNSCSRSCGGGTRTRVRAISVESVCNGNKCDGEVEESEDCNQHCCAVDCEMSEWNSWSSCTETCGVNGISIRRRTIIEQARCGGRQCSGNLHETKQCNVACLNGGVVDTTNNRCDCGNIWKGECCEQDVNECSSGAHNCNDAAECTNIAGTFQCKCIEGFTGDGVYCENVNECTEQKKVCPNNARCEDTIGSFTCTCNEGHRGNGTECKDIDECGTNIHNCDANAICINSPGTFNCTCIHGYKGDGKRCEDVDECVIGLDSCNDDAECTNTDGSFTCTCLKGYSGDGFVCKDIDECSSSDEKNECDENGKCLNIVGSYQCQCSDGYTGDGKTCSDINECDAGSHNCHSWATCKNTPGSFTCMCPEGFIGNGTFCENINECKGNTSKCDENAHCIDKNGTHECVCMKGYEGNGINCTDLNDCSLQQGKCADFNTGAVVKISGFFYQNPVASILLIIGGLMVFTILVFSVYRCSINKTSNQEQIQGGDEQQAETDASTNVNEVPEENIYDDVQGTAGPNAEENLHADLYAHVGGVDSIRGEVVSEVTYDEVQAGNK